MKKRFAIFWVFILFLTPYASAQNQNEPLPGFVINHICQEYALEFTELLPKFYAQGEVDSLFAYKHEWDLRCGLAEPLLRMYLLYQIATNTFSEDFFPDNIFDYLRDYEAVTNSEDSNRYLDYYSWELEEIHSSFNPFSIELAQSLNDYEDLTLTERFFVNFYGNDFESAWKMLNNKKLEGTRLGNLYHKLMLTEFRIAPKPSAWVLAGTWLPRSNLDVYGNLIELGGGIGIYMDGLFFDARIAFGFLGFNNPDQEVQTNNYQIINSIKNRSISLDFGAVISAERRPLVKLGLSIGHSSLMAKKPNATPEKAERLWSFHFGPVIEYLLPIFERNNISLYARYYLIGFSKTGERKFKGDAFMLGAKFGINLYNKDKIGDYYL